MRLISFIWLLIKKRLDKLLVLWNEIRRLWNIILIIRIMIILLLWLHKHWIHLLLLLLLLRLCLLVLIKEF